VEDERRKPWLKEWRVKKGRKNEWSEKNKQQTKKVR
jgi:hypothetical protein